MHSSNSRLVKLQSNMPLGEHETDIIIAVTPKLQWQHCIVNANDAVPTIASVVLSNEEHGRSF